VNAPSNERREYFRVKDHLFVEFREVDEEEFGVLEKSFKEGTTSASSQGQGEFKFAGSTFGKDEIFGYLEMLDRKLNMIIDLLSRRDPTFHGTYTDLVVSGSGLKYFSDVELQEGAFLEVRLVLPFLSKPRIIALAKVVRSRKRVVEGRQTWETAVSFVAMNEKDRDVLVGYVFSKERESLRTRHKR
jgi:hypothetical protein